MNTLLIVAVLCSSSALALKFPLQTCSRSNLNITKCILTAARNSIGILMPGMDSIDLPRLDPLSMGNLDMTAKKGPLSLSLKLSNTTNFGASKVILSSAKYYTKGDANRAELYGYHKALTITANYDMVGKMMFVPLTSTGKAEITLYDVEAAHTIEYKPKNGRIDFKLFFVVNSISRLSIKTQSPHGKSFHSTLDGILNNNWKTLYAAFKPEVEKHSEKVYNEAFAPFFRRFNFGDIQPGYLSKS